uniref:BED-type domain-containing protein n=1 Tax=Ditylenchus dipsaci TaxID=166011 RepID=A0A915EAR2_9BILA
MPKISDTNLLNFQRLINQPPRQAISGHYLLQILTKSTTHIHHSSNIDAKASSSCTSSFPLPVPEAASQQPSTCIPSSTSPNSADIMSRAVDNRGRALRKSAAVDGDEEHEQHLQPITQLGEPFQSTSTSGLLPQLNHQQQSTINSAVAGALGFGGPPGGNTLPTVTDYNLAAQLTTIGLTIGQGGDGQPGLLHPTAIKHEQTMSRDDLLSSFGITNTLANSISPISSWMTLNSPAGVTALASLKALMQVNEGDAAARLTIPEDIKPTNTHFAEMSKLMETRNHSTESTASTSTASGTQCSGLGNSGSNAESIPRKQDIQTDIRMNKGRFQLVRKRGRSEVWNLFGQVVDTLTGSRLPYVACYACKVLYTDTGGGTGNMTRHRCSVGHSYRSIAGSSTDTAGEMHTQSSFESVNNLMLNGPSSPETYVQDSGPAATSASSQYSVNAREAFIQSGCNSGGGNASNSSGFMSGGSASLSSNLVSLDSIAGTSLGGLRSCSISSVTHPSGLFQVQSSSSSISNLPAAPQPPIQPLRPAPIPTVHSIPTTTTGPPAFGAGYVFTQADRQLFAQAVVQFCAQDLHNYDVVEGEGFKNLIESVLFIGRRSHGDASATSFDPVRNLIPSSKQLKQVFNSQEQFVRQATAEDLEAARSVGASFNCQSMTLAEEHYLSISCNYITEDWAITRRSLKVKKCGVEQVGELISEVLTEYNLESAKTILLTLDFELDSSLTGKLPKNVVLVTNINRAINQILRQCLSEAPEKSEIISTFIDLCYRIVKELNGLNALSESLPHKFFSGLEEHTCSEDKRFDYADGVYLTIKFVREHLEQILVLFNKEIKLKNMIAEIHSIDWALAKDLEQLLEPFYETTQIFRDSKQPHFQQIVPEWYALIHEFKQLSGEGSEGGLSPECVSPTQSSSKPGPANSTALDNHCSELSSPPIQLAGFGMSFTPPSKWLSMVRKAASVRLKEWADKNMLVEHKIATALNPRLKHLNLVCSHSERSLVYSRIRSIVGLGKPKKERQQDNNSDAPLHYNFMRRDRPADAVTCQRQISPTAKVADSSPSDGASLSKDNTPGGSKRKKLDGGGRQVSSLNSTCNWLSGSGISAKISNLYLEESSEIKQRNYFVEQT